MESWSAIKSGSVLLGTSVRQLRCSSAGEGGGLNEICESRVERK
jgi:hypothetical protein